MGSGGVDMKMPMKKHRVVFPKKEAHGLDQDESYFYLINEDEKRKFRFHDYGEIYKIQGLYEQLFYERLKCQSPKKVAEILHKSVDQENENFSELRILDFGAGNGLMAEELKKHGVSRLVGVDILQEAYEATVRDHPGLYDAYYVEDFTKLNNDVRDEISSWSFDCMTTVAALGYGDIPVKAFVEAYNIIKNKGWISFNIKETFLDNSDDTGFSKMIRELILSEYMDIYHLERYKHRFSIEGEPLYYFAIAAKKNNDIPDKFTEKLDIPINN